MPNVSLNNQKEKNERSDIIAVKRIDVIKMPPSLSDLPDKTKLNWHTLHYPLLRSTLDSSKLHLSSVWMIGRST